ncbi:hypothetical protein NUU61_002392 [Penicillium alfredii]|uniref:Major facilitator superfamily (MFS) profile domain-containing protein n=1 Tax=Penicillium alfredii TaxID=1506179 RepID=A0A9W9KFZ4_9EURO|nr:uncharacterized protein NUU61_002392 [Penicillium alfredii]KAJ5105045.1 hypothetical protein NUU61_002392 [Penicillium alfredii]
MADTNEKPQHAGPSSPDVEEDMSIGQYILTRIPSLVPPMNPAPNPFKALTLLNRQQWLFFLVAFFGWSWDSFDFFTVSLTASDLAETFDKSVTDITWGITLVLMLRSVGSITFGIASDRWGRKWPFVVNQFLFIVLELGAGFCQTYKQFLACRALFGIAMGGLYGNAAATALEDCPPEARGIISGLLQQGYAFGYLLATAFARGLVNTTPHGWRPLYWFAACPPVLIILFRLCLPETQTFQRRQATREEVRGGVAASFFSEGKVALKRHWLLLLYLVLLMAGFNFMSHGSQDLYPTMLENQFMFSADAVTVTQVVANLGALTGGTLCGWASQIFGRRFSIIVISIVGGALLYPYTFVTDKSVMAAAFFEQFMVQGAWGVIPIHLMELSPGAIRTFAVGTAYQLGNLVSSAHRYEYGKVICIFMGCVFAYTILVTLAGPERLGRNFDAEHDADLAVVAAHRGMERPDDYESDPEKATASRQERV